MARRLVVEVVGDASSLNKTFKQSERSAKHFGQEMSKVTRGAAAGSGVFRGLGRSLAFASGGFLAVASVSSFLRDSVNAARDAAVAQRSLGAQMKANNESFKDNAQLVEKVSLSYGKFGFQNDEVIASLTVLDRATGNINKSIRLQGVTAAIARVKNIDLAAAAAVVGKVFGGQETALRRAVPGLSKTAHGMDLIREAQRKLAGQAAANTTAAERFQAILHNTEEIIGTALLPTLNKYLNRLGEWLQKMDESGKLQRDVKKATDLIATAFDVAKAALTPLVKAFQLLADVVGSNAEAIKLLVAAYATFKTAQIVGGLGGMAASMGLLQGSAEGVTRSFGAKAGIAGAVVLAGYELSRFIRRIPGWDREMKKLGGAAFDLSTRFHILGANDPNKQFGPESDRAVAGLRRAGLLPTPDVLGQAAAKSIVSTGLTVAAAIRKAKAAIAAATKAGGVDAEVSPGRRKANEAQRQRIVDLAQFAVDRTQLTKSLADDLAALQRLNALLKRRIAGGHDTLALQRQQLDVQLKINDVIEQQAAARASARAARKAALEDARQAALDARNARQFRILGFGPTGEDLVPGVKNLKRQLASVTDAIEGTFLDTAKTRRRLDNIRRVLAAGVGNISDDVRSKIQQLIADLKAQLRKTGVDVSRFQKTARGQFTLAGAHGAGSGTVVIGNVHLHGIQNLHDLEVALAKRKKQRAHARGGTR